MRLDDKTLAQKLRQQPNPEPPPELLERLLADLPEALPAPIEQVAAPTASTAGRPVWRSWATAASLVTLVGGGWLAYQVIGQAPPVAPAPESAVADTSAEDPFSRAGVVSAEEGNESTTEVSARAAEDVAELQILEQEVAVADELDRRSEVTVPDQVLEPGVKEKTAAVRPVDRIVRGGTEARPVEPAPVGDQPVSESSLRKITAPRETAAAGEPTLARKQELSEERAELGARLEALGYVQEGEVASGRQRNVRRPQGATSSAPAPPPPSPSPSPRVESKRLEEVVVAPPDHDGASSSRGQVQHDDREAAREEPNRMLFDHYGVNPLVATREDSQSTFGLDVDTGSFTLVRRYLDDGRLPPAAAVRVEEIVNALPYPDLRVPRRADFALAAEWGSSPWSPSGRQLLRWTLQGREAIGERTPTDLILVVDTSGSMNRENRLGLVKRSLELLIEELGAHDRLALVTYGGRGQVVFEPTHERERVFAALDALRPSGSTNLEEGLILAYDLASRTRRRGVSQRLILCSDGVANVGRTGPDSILERIDDEARGGVELTTVGFGMGNYNDVLMEQLADRGDGRYAYVDRLEEAHRLFVEELTGTLQTLGAEARAQVEFNPDIVESYRLLGYENRDIADHRFRDDSVDAGEIGVGHTVTALYELVLTPEAERRLAAGGELATLRLRYRPEGSDRFAEEELVVGRRSAVEGWNQASFGWRLAAVAARFAEILRGAPGVSLQDLDSLVYRAREVAEQSDEETVWQLLDMIEQARNLAGLAQGGADWQ